MGELAVDLWTIAIGILCNTSCAVVGCYLVLRRLSLLGDAISHAVLPGIVLAFVISESRASVPMFAGAMAIGVLTAFLTQTVQRFARVSEDTSMGVVFTTLFALGVVLISVVPGLAGVDLDPACVFEGSIELEPIYLVDFLGARVPRTVPILAVVLIADLAFVGALWKELKVVTFDAALATSLGFSAALLFYLLMAMVAATTVASFWAVGSILVIAMLIVPGATAQLLTDRLGVMLALAALAGVLSAVIGYLLADRWNTSAAGMMAVVAGAQYALAVVLAPRHGLVVRWARQVAMAVRIASEDMLAALYRWEETQPGTPMPRGAVREAGGGTWASRLGLAVLSWRGLLDATAEGALKLAGPGKRLAGRLVRSHRLWESWLSEHVGLPSDHLHQPAMRMEHYVTPELERDLVGGLADARTDPHGRPIPEGEAKGGQSESRSNAGPPAHGSQ